MARRLMRIRTVACHGVPRSHHDQRLIRVVTAAPAPRATFRDVFAVREFRALWRR